MAFTAGGGITINGNITLTTSGPAFSYNAGNSMSYSGSGTNNKVYDLPLSSNIIFDLSSTYNSGSDGAVYIGSVGILSSLNSGNVPSWINQGTASYFALDGGTNQQAIVCDNQNGYNIPAGSNFTYFCTILFNNISGAQGIVSGSSTYFSLSESSGPGGTPGLQASTSMNGMNAVNDTLTTFVPNTWYAVACTYNSTAQTMSLYVNGTLTATGTNIPPFVDGQSLVWGQLFGDSFLNGKLGIMQAYTYPLTQLQIQTLCTTIATPYLTQPQASISALYTVPNIVETFTVPTGVGNISVVTVGGGGGSDTDNILSTAGSPSGVFNIANTFLADTLYTGSGNTVYVDSAVYPNILNVNTTYAVFGNDITASTGNPYHFYMVTSVNSANTSNVVITTSGEFTSTTGDAFTFSPALVAAEGAAGFINAFPIDSPGIIYDNDNGGPGARAQPLVGIGGEGGVVSYLSNVAGGIGRGDYYQSGGAGAGGYSTNANIVAFDPNWTYLYNYNSSLFNYSSPIVLSNNNLTATTTANAVYGPPIASGTYPITSGIGSMFSFQQSEYTSVDAGNSGIGLKTNSTNLQLFLGNDANSAVIWNDGSYNIGSTSGVAGSFPVFQSNNVIDMAVDTDNLNIWIRVDGGDWNGSAVANPTTNTGGVSISTITGGFPFYPAVNLGVFNTTPDTVAYSFKPTSTYSVPSGFTFIPGTSTAGSAGGDGSAINFTNAICTAKSGGAYGGGGGGGTTQQLGSGAAGGGVGLYGLGNPGNPGLSNLTGSDIAASTLGLQATGGTGGSFGGAGGPATGWNGGYGGFPGGGAGGGYSGNPGGNGGALAYVNNITVTPGQQLSVIVGAGGQGRGSGGSGGPGAVRILYNGAARQFPSTNVGPDVSLPAASFTISSNNFADWSTTIPGQFVVAGSLSGLSMGNVYCFMYNPQGSITADISTVFNNFGLAIDGTAYIFHVQWSTGSTVTQGLVRLSFNTTILNVSPVNTNESYWETSSPINTTPPNSVLTGIFNFPAIFTPYFPTIISDGNYWGGI
jgi:hypothetical protein